MADNEIKELLIDLKDAQKETFKRLDELGEKQEETVKRLNELGEKQEETVKRLDELDKKQQNMEKNLLEKIDQVSLAVARIEVEHGEKLAVLLDVVTGHTQKFDSVNERIEKSEKRLDNHDNKFFILKSAVQAY